MKKLLIVFFTIVALSVSVSSTASAQAVFSFREFESFLQVPDGVFWNDVSGALQFCEEDALRGSFHDRLIQKKYGKRWVLLSKQEQAYVNHFIMFGTGIARGLQLSQIDSSKKQEICSGAVAAAKAYIAADA